MKRRILALVLAALMALALLTGCGGGSAPAKTETQSAPAAESAAEASAAAASAAQSAAEASAAASAAQSAAAASEGGKTEAAISPYAWQGLQDMPECPYLDALCTYHYYREFTSYVMGMSTKNTEAVDGINSFKGTDTTRTYSVEGKVITFNDSSKTYMEYDMGEGMIKMAKESMEKAMAQGTNTPGRTFVGTGSGVIPEYSETEGDKAEYEYYEYNYPGYEETGYQMVERFYMKDGDVYAINQQMSKDGEQITNMTEVIKSMSGDIPKGTFDVPSTDGYEELKLGGDSDTSD